MPRPSRLRGLTTDVASRIPEFTQRRPSEGAVDAATGFANNEPIVLRRAGIEAIVLGIDDVTPLPGPGLIAGTSTLETKHDAVAAFVAATLRAMEEIEADPNVGLDAPSAVPGWPRRTPRPRSAPRSRPGRPSRTRAASARST
jgi:hypothetical protein